MSLHAPHDVCRFFVSVQVAREPVVALLSKGRGAECTLGPWDSPSMHLDDLVLVPHFDQRPYIREMMHSALNL